MKGKPEFRLDVSTDFCIIDDNGEPFWVRPDGRLEPVECLDMKRRLLEAAPSYGYVVNSEDVLKDTSWAVRGKKLTVGPMLGEPQDPPGALSTEPAVPGGEVDLSKTSYFVRGRELTVGSTLGERQSPPREEER